MEKTELEQEAKLATAMLYGKTIKVIRRHRKTEIVIEFTDGARLFLDATGDELELSVTGAAELEE